MLRFLLTVVLLALALPGPARGQDVGLDVGLDVPGVVRTGAPFSVGVTGLAPDSALAAGYRLQVGERSVPLVVEDGAVQGEGTASGFGTVHVELRQGGRVVAEASTRAIPGWISIVPPLLAIAVALLFKQVVPALFLGIWVGAWAATGLEPAGLWTGLLDAFQVYVLTALADADHAAIILFSLMIGGMVGIISKNGGMQGIVNHIVGWARTPRKGQIATAVLGLGIFFDDYANTLVVGNTMRSVTDRLRISREKLAYIVDSTAAPVASLALVTTWIGYEVGLIGTAVGQIEGYDESAYSIFLNSIPYSFYPIFALFLVFAVAHTRRDFGPMLEAEVRARTTGLLLRPGAKVDESVAEGKELMPREDRPHRAVNAVVPVLVLLAGVLGGLFVTGTGENLREIIGTADAYRALMWASLLGVLVAGALSVGQRILSLDETIEAWYAGVRAMLFAMIILVLAWSLSAITDTLDTAGYLVSLLGENVPPGVIPALVFVIAAATAFATGTSWGTMGILMPLVVPLAWAVLEVNAMADPEHLYVLYSAVSCVLAGAVWGDHCSPISDTTILSSMASGCDHIDHVRTQLPYALTAGVVAMLLGTLPTGFGMPWWVSLVAGPAVLWLGLRVVGRSVQDEIAGMDVTPPTVLENQKK